MNSDTSNRLDEHVLPLIVETKKFLLACWLVLATVPVWADWVQVSESTQGTVIYADPATIRASGALRRIWLIQSLSTPLESGARSLKGFWEFDCKAQRSRVLQFSAHSMPMGEGAVFELVARPADEWVYVAPGALAAASLKYACTQ